MCACNYIPCRVHSTWVQYTRSLLFHGQRARDVFRWRRFRMSRWAMVDEASWGCNWLTRRIGVGVYWRGTDIVGFGHRSIRSVRQSARWWFNIVDSWFTRDCCRLCVASGGVRVSATSALRPASVDICGSWAMDGGSVFMVLTQGPTPTVSCESCGQTTTDGSCAAALIVCVSTRGCCRC